VKRIIIIIAGIAMLAFTGILAGANSAFAAAPAVQISTNQGDSSLCMNRDGGGTTSGTFIIGYNCGNSDNDFELENLSNMCGAGVGTVTYDASTKTGCPFTNGNLDLLLDGAPLVAIEEYDEGWCAGTSASNTFTIRLEGCPNGSGVGGGWNSTYVAPGFPANSPNCLISIHSTNSYGGTTNFYGLEETGYTGGVAIATGNTSGGCSASAQWYEIYT
jgi:hypothetical protein